MGQKDQPIRKDMKAAAEESGDADTSLDDLRRRGVRKINVLSPQKIEEMIRRRAAEMLREKKDEILGAAGRKIRELADRNRELRSRAQTLQDQLSQHKDCFPTIERLKSRVQDLNTALEQTRDIMERERAKSFQNGAASQRPAIERYQDEVMALMARVRELEEENRRPAGAERDSLKKEMREYREQIRLLTEEIRSLRERPHEKTDAAWRETLKQTEAVIAQYRDEISSLREEIDGLNTGNREKAEEMQRMVSRLEETLSEKISRKMEPLQSQQPSTRLRVKPREVLLDSLFRHEPETNFGALKVRQQSGKSINDSLEKLKSFHENRNDLEMGAADRDAPAGK